MCLEYRGWGVKVAHVVWGDEELGSTDIPDHASVAQWVEQAAVNRGVAGSSPARSAIIVPLA